MLKITPEVYFSCREDFSAIKYFDEVMKMAQKKSRKIKEGPLEKKWEFYTGTGITANKGKNALVLRENIGGGKFAIVKLYGGCWTTSPTKVLEEIKTSVPQEARERFNALAKKLGFKMQPIRTAAILFSYLFS